MQHDLLLDLSHDSAVRYSKLSDSEAAEAYSQRKVQLMLAMSARRRSTSTSLGNISRQASTVNSSFASSKSKQSSIHNAKPQLLSQQRSATPSRAAIDLNKVTRANIVGYSTQSSACRKDKPQLPQKAKPIFSRAAEWKERA